MMERFQVVYRITGDEKDAYTKAKDICLEQTVEFPAELVPGGLIQDHIVGRIEEFHSDGPDHYQAVISYAAETTAFELTQLFNVIFGNISIKTGNRVEKIELTPALAGCFHGPRFGREGLRTRLGIPARPMLFTALKPMGLTALELAELAYKFATGGIDIIKDDHGLSNQGFAGYHERVEQCCRAVERANRETGQRAVYVPNVTAPYGEIAARARFAKEAGAGGLLVAPGLTGFDVMRALADDDEIGLPVFSHPAFIGSYVVSPDDGISHFALFGQMMRLAGADGVVYPNYGGRFSFSRAECAHIAEGTAVSMHGIKSAFPCPGGGMSIDSIPDMLTVYGNEVVFLVGGGLFRHGPDIVENCRYFRSLVEKTQ